MRRLVDAGAVVALTSALVAVAAYAELYAAFA